MSEANHVLSDAIIDADARWNAWVARGVEHDRISSRRAFAVAVLLGLGLAGWLVKALLR